MYKTYREQGLMTLSDIARLIKRDWTTIRVHSYSDGFPPAKMFGKRRLWDRKQIEKYYSKNSK